MEHIKEDESKPKAWICDECLQALKSDSMPKFALANNLWLGPIPHKLSILMLPEQLLVSRHYPRCFIVKLYLHDGKISNPNHLQQGMVGNVTLYNMNTNAIVDMLKGQLMPQPSIQLASVLAITYIGTKKLPKSWLKSTFRVRRRVVYEALAWLKENNEIYADVVISAEQLASLPEDNIPLEILAAIRHEEHAELVEREGGGYVPTNINAEVIGNDLFSYIFAG